MKIYLDFLQIGSRLWTTQFSYGYLASLEILITEFFTCYIFIHFLLHYTMIKTFGWLIKPLRFKSKQGYFKSYLEWNKNRENLFQSMSKKDNLYFVDNKAKGRISKQVFQENKARQIVRKTNISSTCTC